MVISQESGEASVPLRDMYCVVMSSPNIRISSLALAALAEAEVMVIFCNRRRLPAALLVPTESNARQALVMRTQIDMTSRLADALWQKVVIRKITNQAKCLSLLGKNGSEDVLSYAGKVLPGDSENCEGVAAEKYFPRLCKGLKRRTDDPFNSVLSYGYAIIRSLIVREIVATGFLPSVGLHHRNQLNSFNLADDLIEPFRPMVDIIAPSLTRGNIGLSREQKQALIDLPRNACLVDGVKTDILMAIQLEVDSLKRAIEEADPDLLKLPEIILPERMSGVDD